MNKKYFILLISLIVIIFIGNFIVSKNYNKPENIEKRAIKYCVENGNEYRETSNSEGKKLKQCKINDKFVDVVEFYKSNNK